MLGAYLACASTHARCMQAALGGGEGVVSAHLAEAVGQRLGDQVDQSAPDGRGRVPAP